MNIFKKILPDKDYFNPAACLASIVKNNLDGILGQKDIRFVVSGNPEKFKLGGKYFFNTEKPIEIYE